MYKVDLHARTGDECHALQRIESREPSTKALQHSSLATIEQCRVLCLCLGIVRGAEDVDVAAPTLEAQTLTTQREHQAIGGALGGGCTVPESVAKLNGMIGIKKEGCYGHWWRSGTCGAPRRRALSLSLCVAGVGGARGTDARRHGGSMLQKLTKLDPMASCHPFIHLLVTIKPVDAFMDKGQQKPTWRRLAPLVLGLGRRLGGARRHEALIRQNRAHGQIHCHVSAMSASSVHVVGGASQISWPA
jgi:hypothetical protein